MLTRGLPAGPGAATGMLCLSAETAEIKALQGPTILARLETSPEDLRGMLAAAGILTAKGGVSSHAAVVARQMGKVCVAGASEIEIDYENGILKCGDREIPEGSIISINGSTGEILDRGIATAPSRIAPSTH